MLKELTPVLVLHPPFAEAGVQAAISCPERSLGAGPSASSDSCTWCTEWSAYSHHILAPGDGWSPW